MNRRFRISVGSVPDRENLVGDLYYDDHVVCVVSYENRLDDMQLELHAPPNGGRWRFEIADFNRALAELKARIAEIEVVKSEDRFASASRTA